MHSKLQNSPYCEGSNCMTLIYKKTTDNLKDLHVACGNRSCVLPCVHMVALVAPSAGVTRLMGHCTHVKVFVLSLW